MGSYSPFSVFVAPYRTVCLSVCGFCSVFIFIKIIMNAYHAALWSSSPSPNDNRYRYDGYVVPWCLYLRTIVCTDEHGTFRCLEIAPKDEPDLWRATICFG